MLEYNNLYVTMYGKTYGIDRQDMCKPKVGIVNWAVGQRPKRWTFNSWQDQEILISAITPKWISTSPPAFY
jgi:hypothetical protein